ncbi:MAG: adenylate/guanylate cyclase domain-containing protein [Roseburia sp.]|nr:adenylate/guanylate cyclase domain-containing protein [Roseburia sp.]MCM1096825.1 adenylate/guanylate cyclase domain-containing protein [Ruminococcus flavefaciens]
MEISARERKRNLYRLFAALAIAALLTLLAGAGLLRNPDLALSDWLYQSRQASDGKIVLVGIDQRAIQELGPYDQWGREIMAEAIEYLNKAEDCRPAVIGLDVLYTGESDPEPDRRLAEAAGAYGNVIAASAAVFENGFVEVEDNIFSRDRFAARSLEEPYRALREAAQQGHINAMLDTDGILRHHMLTVALPDGWEIPSLALAAANLFQAYRGGEPVERPPVSSHGFWYLPFCGEPGDFWTSVSVADLLNGEIPAESFAGKIVLIGPYAPGLQDSYFTSIDHARPMYGVEYQANAIQALLWGDYKREVGDGLQLGVLFFLLLLSLAAFWRRPVKVSTAVWLFLSGGWAALCKLLYIRGFVLHVLWVPAGVTVLYAGCLAANYIRAALEKRKITRTFQHYVAPEIVRELLKEGKSLELGGKQVEIAVLFVDVRGFTTMSEALEPTRVVEILNRYLTMISECILNRRGTLDKFVGDAVMAFWGAPLPQEDYIMNAVQAAMDMVRGSEELSRELTEQYGRTVAFGVGVHAGPAVVGNIGSSRRMDYTAIGDTVNTAARLEANAPGGTVYISRAVADALKGRIRAVSLGDTVKLKGKKEGFEVLRLDEILEGAV